MSLFSLFFIILLTFLHVTILSHIALATICGRTAKQSVFLRIQVRANSQTKGLELSWKQRGRLGRDANGVQGSRASSGWDSYFYATLNRFWEKTDCLQSNMWLTIPCQVSCGTLPNGVQNYTRFAFPWYSGYVVVDIVIFFHLDNKSGWAGNCASQRTTKFFCDNR